MECKSCFMRSLSALFALTLLAGPAWANTTASIAGVSVQCSAGPTVISMTTVVVKFDGPFTSFITVEFKNVSTGQATSYPLAGESMQTQSGFSVPPGTYTLTAKPQNGEGSESPLAA